MPANPHAQNLPDNNALEFPWELELPGLEQPPDATDLFFRHQRERLIVEHLRRFVSHCPLQSMQVLDLGCIRGDILPLLMSYGALPQNLHACGLIKPTLEWLKTNYPNIRTQSVQPSPLPYESKRFDVIFLFSMFGLMFDGTARQHVALEAERMLKTGGFLFWYDLKPVYQEQREWQRRLYRWLTAWQKPQSQAKTSVVSPDGARLIHTQPVDRVEIELLFSDCQLQSLRETGLYRPVSQLLAPRGWGWLLAASRLPMLKTHYFAVLQKQGA